MNTDIKIAGLPDKLWNLTDSGFEEVALEIFRFQFEHNSLYRDYCKSLGRYPDQINHIDQIPFLPIGFFKTHSVQTTQFDQELYFESSGTTGTINSKHYIKDVDIYDASFLTAFKRFYGDPGKFCIIALLPSYLERKHSSLIRMVEKLIQLSGHKDSGFYLYEHQPLQKVLLDLEKAETLTLLIGVTYALLDFAENFGFPLAHTLIMETGGMKGRREEITREEVHQMLKDKFHLSSIHSEYGMTELLSQAYSKGDGIFQCPPWMKIVTREMDDPFSLITPGQSRQQGLINIIDLANIYSCSFIATEDIGMVNADGSFEVNGRMDHADIRGCSLLTL